MASWPKGYEDVASRLRAVKRDCNEPSTTEMTNKREGGKHTHRMPNAKSAAAVDECKRENTDPSTTIRTGIGYFLALISLLPRGVMSFFCYRCGLGSVYVIRLYRWHEVFLSLSFVRVNMVGGEWI